MRRAAENRVSPLSIHQLRRLCASARSRDRLKALAAMRRQLWPRLPRAYLDLATPLISDPDNACRWQALCVAAEYIEKSPECIWDIIARHAPSDDEDMRAGIHCCILERLSWQQVKRWFPRLTRLIEHPGSNAAKTIGAAWRGNLGTKLETKLEKLIGKRLRRQYPASSASKASPIPMRQGAVPRIWPIVPGLVCGPFELDSSWRKTRQVLHGRLKFKWYRDTFFARHGWSMCRCDQLNCTISIEAGEIDGLECWGPTEWNGVRMVGARMSDIRRKIPIVPETTEYDDMGESSHRYTELGIMLWSEQGVVRSVQISGRRYRYP